MKLTNASDKPLEFSATPNVEDALSGWMRKIVVGIVTKTIVDFEVHEDRIIHEIMGVRQPFTSKQLMILPYGQRAWSWENLHVKASEILFELDDQIVMDNKKYRIMQKWEWADRGYTNYYIVEDWGQNFENSISESQPVSEGVTNAP